MSAEHNRGMPPGGSLRGVAAVPAEPSWGRVLATTIELWVSRRLRPEAWKLVLALVATAAVVVAVLQLVGAFSGTASPAVRSPSAAPAGARGDSARSAAATQAEAGAWIVGQVSDSAIVGCYPAVCAALQADGVSASRLMPLGPGLAGALAADVIVTTPAAGRQSVRKYAPVLIASFGSGGARIEVRAVARGGAAAYEAAMRADLAARQSAGSELLKNPSMRFTVSDAARLRAGEVDSRLLATLAMLSSQYAFRAAAFGDSSPGAQLLFRSVTVTSDGKGSGTPALKAALALVNAQERPFLPAYSAIVRLHQGQPALRIEFAEPSPLGLLTTVLTADVRPADSDER